MNSCGLKILLIYDLQECSHFKLQKEQALPEQFKTTWNGREFVTICTESIQTANEHN